MVSGLAEWAQDNLSEQSLSDHIGSGTHYPASGASLLRSRELNKNIIWAQEIFILFTTAQFYLRLLEQVSLSLDICRAIITSSHKSKSAASELLYHSRILWWLCLWILNVWDLLSKVKIRINLTGKLGEDLSSDKTFNFSPHRCAAAGGWRRVGTRLWFAEKSDCFLDL